VRVCAGTFAKLEIFKSLKIEINQNYKLHFTRTVLNCWNRQIDRVEEMQSQGMKDER
jgi:hypothetical protein